MEYVPEDWKKSGPSKNFRLKQRTQRIPFGIGLLIILVVGPLVVWGISRMTSPVGAAIFGGLGLIGLIGVGVLALVLTILPIVIAVRRNHPQTLGITLLTIFLGWTLLGWLAALIWATWSFAADRAAAPLPRNRTEAGE